MQIEDGLLIKTIKNSTSVPYGGTSNDSRYAFISVEGKGGEPGIADVIDLKSLKLVDKVEVESKQGESRFGKKKFENGKYNHNGNGVRKNKFSIYRL